MGIRHSFLTDTTLSVGAETFSIDSEGVLSPAPSADTEAVLLQLPNYERFGSPAAAPAAAPPAPAEKPKAAPKPTSKTPARKRKPASKKKKSE